MLEKICAIMGMAHPFTRAQALQNMAFLERLALSGNVRLAAREVGVAYGTIQHRRSTHAEFAQAWEAVVAAVHARFHLAGGRRGPEARFEQDWRGRRKEALDPSTSNRTGGAQDARGRGKGSGVDRGDRSALRTRGGEAVVVRTRSGRLQLRLAHRGKLNAAAEQAFLRALSASANIRLSAAAAGASARAFYRRRQQDPAFAREMRLALQMGYERLEMAALKAALPESHSRDGWQHNRPPPIPPMSADQALQLLFLHEKSVRQGWEQPHRRRRRGESEAVYRERLRAMWACEKRRDAEDAALHRAARYEESGEWGYEDEAPPLPLPPLHLVTGWSRADPAKGKHHPEVALFGGWRIADMEKRLAGKR